MNCPSRTDDITLEHPTWNQSPPFLAPDLTTCEDLNGMANAREHRHGSEGDGSIGGNQEHMDHLTHPHLVPDGPPARPASSGPWERSVSHVPTKDVLGGEDQPRPSPVIPQQAARFPSSTWGWIAWTASVLVCSSLISHLRIPGSFLPSRDIAPASASPAAAAAAVCPDAVSPVSPAFFSASQPAKRSTCGGGGADVAEYNVGLHVGALFIMIAVSFFSCAFALIAKKIPMLRAPPSFFFGVRHFGTGVLLATAFVHLLPTAFILLGDDCLSSFWIDDYDAMPGAIALAAVFFVAVIEMIFQPARHMIPAQGNRVIEATGAGAGAGAAESGAAGTTPAMAERRPSTASDDHSPMEMGHVGGASESLGRTLSRLSRAGEITANTETDDAAQRSAAPSISKGINDIEGQTDMASEMPRGCGYHGGSGGYILSPAQKHQKDVLQCMMLEVGILFHSIFIGMTLAVSTGSQFIVLLVAIIFHQTFEGLALGSRIADISWHEGALQPWLMALAYGCTTPIGQAIGIATHSLYDPDSEFGLVLVGTMNAISSGLLVFAALVELLAEDFLSDESWRVLRGKKRVIACLLVFAGAFGMSIVGAWA